MLQQMRFEDITPFVRIAMNLDISKENCPPPALSYDHRLFYVIGGTGSIDIDGTDYEIGPGSVMYWMSGIRYAFRVDDEPLNMIAVNFDFTQNNSSDTLTYPTVAPQSFDKNKILEHIAFTNFPALNNPICLFDSPAVLPYLQAMIQESAIPTLLSNFHLTNLMRVVLTVICRADAYANPNKHASDSFQKILHYIQDHYAQPLTNKTLAKRFNYHPNYITQLFTTHTGISLHQYLLRIRVRHALYLLQTTEQPISEIASQTGFCSTSYFCQYFKKCTGYSPSSFRL